MSKPLRVILAVFGLLITLYASLVAIMSTEWFHNYLLRQAETGLEGLTGARVEIGAMIIRPTVLLVTLEGLVLHGRESVSEPPLLSARTVVVRINPLGFLRSRVLLQSLDCDRVEVHLKTYADGGTNLPGPQRPSKEGGANIDPSRVRFDKMTASFERAPGRIAIQDGVIYNPSMGLTAQGAIDFDHNQIDVSGSFVPAYTVNTMLTKIPLIGPCTR